MNNLPFIARHDHRDIGWRVPFGKSTQHYYRGNSKSNVCLSHCGQVEQKAMLGRNHLFCHCVTCATIEQARIESEK